MERELNASGARRSGHATPLASAALLLLLSLFGFADNAAHAAGLADLGEVKGKLVWVDFWASWCEPCRRSFPWLNQMQARYAPQGLEVIGINLDSDKAAAQKFLREVPAHFTLKFDPEGKVATKFDVQAMPSSFLLDASGNVVASHLGFRLTDTAQYEAQIKKALSGSK